MPDTRLIERIAGELLTSPTLVEKDWHVVRALKTLADSDFGEARLVFGGGTCLSKAWGLIQRFSEDIDFKAEVPAEYGRSQRRALRNSIERVLTSSGFTAAGPATVRDEGRFFGFKLDYASSFPMLEGLRPHIQVEVTLRAVKMKPVSCPVQSFVAQAQGEAPEVASIACIDPTETAAEKLSALAWRVVSHRTRPEDHDPTIIRHLHDLAALRNRATASPSFAPLARQIVKLDSGRGAHDRPMEFRPLMKAMLDDLGESKHWRQNYDLFIRQVSYATDTQRISFDDALTSLRGMVAGLTNVNIRARRRSLAERVSDDNSRSGRGE